MTNKPAWALLGVDACEFCGTTQFLFTHSLVNELPYSVATIQPRIVACVRCHRVVIRHITSFLNDELADKIHDLVSNSPTMNPDTYPILKTIQFCRGCGLPEADSEPLVPASLQSDRTIIVQVHERCRMYARCCGITYMSTSHYSWAHDSNINALEPPDNSDRLMVTDIENRAKCQLCLDQFLEERGHSLDEYFSCNMCSTLTHDDDAVNIGGDSYCERCVENNRMYCDSCDSSYWEEEEHDCDRADDLIYDYSYKPSPCFFPPKSESNERLYFGVELEVEVRNSDRRRCAELVLDSLGQRVYLKEDGSLTNGFEIVTHPHSLDEFKKYFPHRHFDTFRREGMRSWDTTTCGLHVHVSRDAFGIPYDYRTTNQTKASYLNYISKRQSHELRFIKLIYDNEAQVCKLAGRKSGYAHFGDKGNLVAKVRGDDDDNEVFDRHVAVNTRNDSTLEVRIFKGSLRTHRILGAVEFVHAGVEYTRDLKVNGKNRALSWLAFCGYIHEQQEMYPNLYALVLKAFNDERDPGETNN